VLLGVVVSVHQCRSCRRYFRAQPPFLRPDAVYTNRVVAKAVEAVYRDGLAFRRVAARLARDFWVQPSEAMIRRWCRAYAATWEFDRDYLPWVVETFSGVLCIDEVYQGQLALLLAVDPAGADGDRLVGYQLVQGSVDQATMNNFLCRLRAAGINPAQIITDGAAIYPSLLAEVWPTAAQQLCLFHESRRVTTAVNDVLKAVHRRLPTPPPATRATLGGRPRLVTPAAEATDHSTTRWRWREASRAAALARVHELRRRGVSLREIAQQTGLNRRTVTKWLRYETPPDLVATRQPCRAPCHSPSRHRPRRGRVGRRCGRYANSSSAGGGCCCGARTTSRPRSRHSSKPCWIAQAGPSCVWRAPSWSTGMPSGAMRQASGVHSSRLSSATSAGGRTLNIDDLPRCVGFRKASIVPASSG
jgi:transposase-like protein